MGCSGCKNIETNNNKRIGTDNTYIPINNNFIFDNPEKIIDLDLKGKFKDPSNNFKTLCQNNFPNLENLNLSNNNLSDISELQKLKAPKLIILDLSNNNIKDLEVFKKVDFVLEELYLKGNSIDQIGVFVEAKSLENLKILHASIIDNENTITNMKKNNIILREQLIKKVPTLELSLSVKK